MANAVFYAGLDEAITVEVILLAKRVSVPLVRSDTPGDALRKLDPAQPRLVLIDASIVRAATAVPWPPGWERLVLAGDRDRDPELWEYATLLGATHIVNLPSGRAWLSDRMAEHA